MIADITSDDEYLEIPTISRQRAGTYECTAVNDIDADTQTVDITVNCESTERSLWSGNLKVPKVELLPKKSSSGTELPLSTNGNHLRGSLVGYCLLLPLF